MRKLVKIDKSENLISIVKDNEGYEYLFTEFSDGKNGAFYLKKKYRRKTIVELHFSQYTQDKKVRVDLIKVEKLYRGTGLGTYVMKYLLDKIRKESPEIERVSGVIVPDEIEDKEKVFNFYKKLGFDIDEKNDWNFSLKLKE